MRSPGSIGLSYGQRVSLISSKNATFPQLGTPEPSRYPCTHVQGYLEHASGACRELGDHARTNRASSRTGASTATRMVLCSQD